MQRTEDATTFAYLLLSCSWTPELESELAGWYHGDIIEAFAEGEDQLDPWSFGWEEQMARVAPVQLTRGWDPRPYMRSVLLAAGIEPQVAIGYSGEVDNALYFAQLPADANAILVTTNNAPDTSDRHRFDQVLTATAELARKQDRGILFVGGEGWYYEMEVPPEATPSLRDAGFMFLTRHV